MVNVECKKQQNVFARFKSWLFEDMPEFERCHFDEQKIENVRMLERYNSKNTSSGTLYITTTHIIFKDPIAKKDLWIYVTHIAQMERLNLTTTGCPLQIRCKNFQCVTFVIPRERDCYDIYSLLQQLSQIQKYEDLYCFYYTASAEKIPKHVGWNFFDLQAEFLRMRVPNDYWTISAVNKDYELCDTYAQYLCVPTSVTKTILIGSSKFRSKGRLPVLSYFHANKAAICRSSQPLSGFNARCFEDEQMLNCILKANPNAQFMYVVDTRPKINAMANRATGKGYENEAFYENIKFQFLGIENIHVMRNSLSKLLDACESKNPAMTHFISGLESSGWLKHVKSILDTSWFIAKAIDDGVSVVVHCSDGWDRTAQVCSLAQLMLDPYYRTVQGFQALIEKDWLAFGHKFSARCGHLQTDAREISPVFVQLLDCTWQLMQQFQFEFEFNEHFLVTLLDHVMACQYGTFIGNSQKERNQLRVHERTFSLWGYMANHMNEFINPTYERQTSSELLKPYLAPQAIKFWRGMYTRHENGVHPRESLDELLLASCDQSNSLEDHIKYLTKKIGSVRSMISTRLNQTRKAPDDADECTSNTVRMPNKLSDAQPCNDSHPLHLPLDTTNEPRVESSGMNELLNDINSVALDWKSPRNVTSCACSAPFDQFSRKHHCWKCGHIYCTRCITNNAVLPGGSLSNRTAPVCKSCFESVLESDALDS